MIVIVIIIGSSDKFIKDEDTDSGLRQIILDVDDPLSDLDSVDILEDISDKPSEQSPGPISATPALPPSPEPILTPPAPAQDKNSDKPTLTKQAVSFTVGNIKTDYLSPSQAKISVDDILLQNKGARFKGTLKVFVYDEKTKFFRSTAPYKEYPISLLAGESLTIPIDIIAQFYDFSNKKYIVFSILNSTNDVIATKEESFDLVYPYEVVSGIHELSVVDYDFVDPSYGLSELISIDLFIDNRDEPFIATFELYDNTLDIKGEASYIIKKTLRKEILLGKSTQTIKLGYNFPFEGSGRSFTLTLLDSKGKYLASTDFIIS